MNIFVFLQSKVRKSVWVLHKIELSNVLKIERGSLAVYTKKYNPRYRMRFSMLNLQYNDRMLSSPAPLAGWMDKWMTLLRSVTE